jgi:nitrite reductase/ring-hydroxylating ferredoxin subunit
LSACEKVNYRSSVPNVPVNYTLYITTEFPHFIVDNGFQALTITSSKYERESVGYAGLLIWTAMDGHYHAADLCCPNCLKRNKPVEVDGLFAICPLCDEHFDLSYGYAFPTKGKTDESLKKYQVLLNNNATGQVLRITN